jgi:hypothetical protein
MYLGILRRREWVDWSHTVKYLDFTFGPTAYTYIQFGWSVIEIRELILRAWLDFAHGLSWKGVCKANDSKLSDFPDIRKALPAPTGHNSCYSLLFLGEGQDYSQSGKTWTPRRVFEAERTAIGVSCTMFTFTVSLTRVTYHIVITFSRF